MQRISTAVAGVIVAAALFASCGSDTKTTAPTVALSTTTASTTAPTTGATTGATTGDTTATTPGTDAPVDTTANTAPGAGSDFCSFQEELNNTNTPLDEANPVPADVQKWFTTTLPAALAKMKDLAPADLKDDVATLTEGFGKIGELLAKNGWDPSKAFADPGFADIANDETYNTASLNLDAYCGIGS